MTAARDLEPLLAHVSWVRTLALHLCADVHAAEDAAQDTWAMALRHGLRHPAGARAFLGRTLRNALAMSRRSDRRRLRREQLAARSADAADVDASELVARADLHRQLVIAVLALPEPQRGLVLRHYFEGQDIATLAGRMQISADAVRAHLRRARDRLRAELERGGGAPARAFGLLVAAGKPLVPAVAGVMLLMKLKIVLATAAALAAVWLLVPMPGPPSRNADGSADAAIAATVAAGLPSTSTNVDQDRSSDPAAPLRTELQPFTAAPFELHGRLVGLHPQVPWTTALAMRVKGWELEVLGPPGQDGISLGRQHPREHEDRVVVGADGAFVVTLPGWARRGDEFELRLEAREPFYLALAATFGAEVRGQDGPLLLQVEPVSILIGRVVDPQGTGVPRARVCVFEPNDRMQGESPSRGATDTDAEGNYQLKAPLATALLVLAVPRHGDGERHRDDLMPASTRVRTQWGKLCTVPDLCLREPVFVSGSVTDRDGTPLPGVQVMWAPQSPDASLYDRVLGNLMCWTDGSAGRMAVARTDANGRFRLPSTRGWPGVCAVNDHQGRLEPFVELIRVAPPAEVNFRIAGGIGVVRLHRGGAPMPGVPVAADTIGEQLTAWNPRLTDARGEVRFLRSQRSVQKLMIRPAGGTEQVVELPVDASPAAPLVVALPPLETVPVRLDCEAALVIPVALTCRRLDGERVPLHHRLTADTPFEVALPPGRYQFVLGAPEDAARQDSFVLPFKQDVEVPLSGALPMSVVFGGRVRITMTNGEGRYVGGNVKLTGVGGSFNWWLNGTNPQDSDNLPAGSYELEIQNGNLRAYQGTITINPREVTKVRVRLP